VTGVEVIRLAELREGPLSVDELRAAVSDPGAGGIAMFAGAIRESDHGRAVTRLSYSAHPSAAAELRRVAEKVAADFEAIALAAVHRTGDLEIGDLSVVVAASCAHRAEAFEACRELIDRVKHEVPIWKRQWFRDGSSEWVGGA
jgi:molybdopterin synthase catalytic subunit